MYEETDGWVRRASGEIRIMLSMPSIMVFLTFETELGEYTEATTRWHKSPSEYVDSQMGALLLLNANVF